MFSFLHDVQQSLLISSWYLYINQPTLLAVKVARGLDNIDKYANFGGNSANESRFGSFERAWGAENNGISSVRISDKFVTQNTNFHILLIKYDQS